MNRNEKRLSHSHSSDVERLLAEYVGRFPYALAGGLNGHEETADV